MAVVNVVVVVGSGGGGGGGGWGGFGVWVQHTDTRHVLSSAYHLMSGVDSSSGDRDKDRSDGRGQQHSLVASPLIRQQQLSLSSSLGARATLAHLESMMTVHFSRPNNLAVASRYLREYVLFCCKVCGHVWPCVCVCVLYFVAWKTGCGFVCCVFIGVWIVLYVHMYLFV